jgi:hypothetical protein
MPPVPHTYRKKEKKKDHNYFSRPPPSKPGNCVVRVIIVRLELFEGLGANCDECEKDTIVIGDGL